MKRAFVILFVFVLSKVHGQESPNVNFDFLPGTWMVNIEATIASIPAHVRANYDNLTSEVKERINNQFTRQQYSYGADGTYQEVGSDGSTYSGIWTVTGPILQVEYSDGEVVESQVDHLSQDVLVLRLEDISSPALFHYLHLTLIER